MHSFHSVALPLNHGVPIWPDQRKPEELQRVHRNDTPTEGSAQQRHSPSSERVGMLD